jgi:hypothetical protein
MPLKSRMTTNVDPVLKYVAGPNVVVRSYPDTFQVIHVAETAIFYLHGIAIKNGVPDGSNLIFCNADMERAYGKGSLTSFIEQVLLSFDVLFVGCRLGEDKIDNIFRRLKTIYDEFPENSPRRHRILVDDFDDTRRLESLGIIPIRYPKIDDAHSGLDRVLQSVADMQQQQTIFIAQQRDLEESRSVL